MPSDSLPVVPPEPAAADSAIASAAAGFLLGRIDYERTPPAGNATGTFRLDRMTALLQRLGDPQWALPCVHIAGSKGKGSTAAMTAAMLTAAGLRSGLFTSPHIHRFEERIQVDGTPIPATVFETLVDRLRPVAEAMDREPLGGPTFFELTTALAWMYFLQAGVEFVVLEVGLGGRLDATNVCRPLATVITSISRDHTRLLGDTLEAIAGEKAGIIKPGVPVLTAVSDAGPLDVIRNRAIEQHAECFVIGEHLHCQTRLCPPAAARHPLPRHEIDVTSPWGAHQGLVVPLPGLHQTLNTTLAVAAVDLLSSAGFGRMSDAAIRHGLSAVDWPLRIEVAARSPWLILDAAHNEASIAALVETLRPLPARRRVVIFAASRDKDAQTMLRLLSLGFSDVILTRFLNNPRAIPTAELARYCAHWPAAQVQLADTPAAALDQARRLAGAEDLICATGSFFLAGEVRELVTK